MKTETAEILYHYTDFHALDGILTSSELRVNNILNMNDAAEMRLFMRGLCKAVTERLIEYGYNEKARSVEELFKRELKKEFTYSGYAACFSRYRDDAAQWERYGNRGRGVCIAFRGDLLKKIVGGAVTLQTVFYQDDMTEHELVQIFFELFRTLPVISEDIKEVSEAMDSAWVCSAAFKHPSFACENEVRMVVSPFEKEYFNVSPRYHVSKDRIKKYYPLNLKQMCHHAGINIKELICELIIGPESTQSLPILQDYLRDNRLEWLADKVILSDCPLRRSNI